MVKYTYDAWGNIVTEVLDCNANVIAELNPFRYRSYYYDTETGLYFLRSRYYDPELGRFMTIDDISYLDPDTINGLNLYYYCMNNPVMYADSDGHFPKWAAWLLSGMIIVGGIGLTVATASVGGIIGGILIGAGAGSIINGYVAEANGGNFFSEYIGGFISGALCGLGAGLGGAAFIAASEAVNFACIAYIAVGVTTSFIGGFAGNLLGTLLTSFIDFGYINVDLRETAGMSTVMGALNIFAGMGAGMSSAVGSMVGTATDLNSQFSLKLLAGLIAGGTEAAYDLTSYLLSKLISIFNR